MAKNKGEKFIELLSEQEICELHEAFNIFDVESDGSIEAKNLPILMNALNQKISKEEIENILKEIDINNDGQIYFNQFLKIMAKRLKNVKEDEDRYLKSLFYSLDRNRNGLISIHEIKYIVTHSSDNITDEDIGIIMKEADTDGDGLVSLEEFMTIMKNWVIDIFFLIWPLIGIFLINNKKEKWKDSNIIRSVRFNILNHIF